MGRIQREFRSDGIKVVAINIAPWSTIDEWRDFWKSKDAEDVTWATDANQEVVRLYGAFAAGTTVIINQQGQITYRDAGATPYQVLRREVVALL